MSNALRTLAAVVVLFFTKPVLADTAEQCNNPQQGKNCFSYTCYTERLSSAVGGYETSVYGPTQAEADNNMRRNFCQQEEVKKSYVNTTRQ